MESKRLAMLVTMIIVGNLLIQTQAHAPHQAPAKAPPQDPPEDPPEAPAQAPAQDPPEDPPEAPAQAPAQDPPEAPAQAPAQDPPEAPAQDPPQAPPEAPPQDPPQTPPKAPPSHHFRSCYPGCIITCAIEKKFKFPETLLCPLTCIKTCLLPQVPVPSPTSQIVSADEIDHTDYYCKLGCATHHCVSLSSVQNPNVDKVAECVDSCSDKCTTNN